MDLKIVISFLFGGNFLILVLLVAYRKKYADEAIRNHFFAQLAMIFSYPFGLARFYYPVDFFAILNTLPFIVSCYFESLALLALSDALSPKMRKSLRIILLGGSALYIASVLVFDAISIRILVMSAVNIILILPPAIRVLRVRDGSALRVLMGILFFTVMAALVVRVVDAFRLGPALVIFGPSVGEIANAASLYMYLVLGGLGIILLAKEKTDARLVRLAYYDNATGTLNRDGFIDAMMPAIEKSSYDNEPFSMLIIDIDGLNEINEIYGYSAGDGVIADVVDKLSSVSGDKSFIGRLSGDEFMVFRKGMDYEGLGEFAAKLKASMGTDPNLGLSYSVCLGGAAFEYPAGKDIQFPMVHAACADALKSAKMKGKGAIVLAQT